MATVTDDAILKIKYDILLKQFEMLRHEAHQRLGFYIQIYQIYAIGLTAVYGYIVAARHWDILLLFPVISLSLYLRLVWDQKVLFFISDYLNSNIAPWFNEVMECNPQLGPKQQQWMIWDQYYPQAFDTFPPFYKHSAFIILVLSQSCHPSFIACIILGLLRTTYRS
jgi:hypothetical protein